MTKTAVNARLDDCDGIERIDKIEVHNFAPVRLHPFGYIAPEVFTGGPLDERADIFAIGMMVVETLVGERPFGGQTPHEVPTTLLHSEYHLPGESIEIRSLDAIVQRCLAKDPRDRYGSATEVPKELVPTLARCEGFEAQGDDLADSIGSRTRARRQRHIRAWLGRPGTRIRWTRP